MKTKIYLYTTVTIIFSLLIIGCQKEQSVNQETSMNSLVNIKSIKLIESFRSRLNSKLKTTDNIPADSVEWYLGANINYTYGNARVVGPDLSVDTSYVSLQIRNENVPLEDLGEIYNELIDSVRTHYYSIDNNDKSLLAVDVKRISQTAQQIEFRIISIIVYGRFISDSWEFDTNDYWTWWDGGTSSGGGYCGGPNYGNSPGTDAADKIQQRVMFRKELPVGNYCYIPPMQTIYLGSFTYYNPSHSGPFNYFNFYLYYNDSNYPLFHGCLMPYEMNFYLSGAEHIVYTANNAPNPGARPPALSFMTLHLNGNAYLPASYSIYFHEGEAYYGTLIPSGGLPDNL